MTSRQEKILHRLIEHYVSTGEPVASSVLEEKYDFGISPATMRSEMNALEDEGFLEQPHISAGRVPTDKAYRLFVNCLIKGDKNAENPDSATRRFEKEAGMLEGLGKEFGAMQEMTKKLAEFSSSLAMAYFQDEGLFFKEGWDEIAKIHEFEHSKVMSRFAEMVEDFETNANDFECENDLLVKIGREIDFDKTGEFSILAVQCASPNTRKKMFLALAGPKRMSYKRNIKLIKSAKKIVEKAK